MLPRLAVIATILGAVLPAAAQLPEPAGGAVAAVCEAAGGCTACGAELGACETDRDACNGDLDACTTERAACGEDREACTTERAACTGDLETCDTERSQAQSDLAACEDDSAACGAERAQCDADLGTCGGALASCESGLGECGACGNGALDANEPCDAGLLAGATCASATGGQRPEGELRCGPGCTLDTSDCREPCTEDPVVHVVTQPAPPPVVPGAKPMFFHAGDSYATFCGVRKDLDWRAPSSQNLWFEWQCLGVSADQSPTCIATVDGWNQDWTYGDGSFKAIALTPQTNVQYWVTVRVYWGPSINRGRLIYSDKTFPFTSAAQ